MICINQNTGERNKEPLETLIRMRGSKVRCEQVLTFDVINEINNLNICLAFLPYSTTI